MHYVTVYTDCFETAYEINLIDLDCVDTMSYCERGELFEIEFFYERPEPEIIVLCEWLTMKGIRFYKSEDDA